MRLYAHNNDRPARPGPRRGPSPPGLPLFTDIIISRITIHLSSWCVLSLSLLLSFLLYTDMYTNGLLWFGQPFYYNNFT